MAPRLRPFENSSHTTGAPAANPSARHSMPMLALCPNRKLANTSISPRPRGSRASAARRVSVEADGTRHGQRPDGAAVERGELGQFLVVEAADAAELNTLEQALEGAPR